MLQDEDDEVVFAASSRVPSAMLSLVDYSQSLSTTAAEDASSGGAESIAAAEAAPEEVTPCFR